MSAPTTNDTKPRSQGDVRLELMKISGEKWAAVKAEDFAGAAALRDRERTLQQEWRALGGPAPGRFRVTIDRPDGSHHVSEAPTLLGALEFSGGIRDVSKQLDAISQCARLLNDVLRTLDAPPPRPSGTPE